MKKRLQGLIAGVLIGTILTSGAVVATNTTTLYDVIVNGVKNCIRWKRIYLH